MDEPLFSVRMRATCKGSHISGAERIAGLSELDRMTSELAGRAMGHERGMPDSISISIDPLAGREIAHFPLLPVTVHETRPLKDARGLAVSELVKAGVSEAAARTALNAVTTGAASKGVNMRGAMIVDASTGERLEPDRRRGIRARAVDYDKGSISGIADALKRHGLDRTHLKEALALASKVAYAPGAVAELCISDDPSYITGYVASKKNGYMRITAMKEQGDPMGGRAFFVDSASFELEAYIAYMRETPVLIKGEVDIKQYSENIIAPVVFERPKP